MLYDLLSEEERAFVREALMDKGIRPFHRDMVVMNRMPSQNTNHIARIVSGIGQAATVLYGEDPENPSMEPYLSGILTKFRAYLDNNHGPGGGAGEPFIYLAGATAYSAELMAVLEKNFGVDWSETTDAGSFYHYPLYATDAAGKYADYGDGGRIYDRFTNLAGQWFVHRTGDPLLYSYVKPYWEQGNGGYLGYLWYRDDIEPTSRKSLPTSFFVEKNGIQLMRSGWEDESTVISFKAGPHANHFHYDQGTFRIMTNGSELITDPLIPDGGYYTNLEFPVYNIHAISKNVMLIDHDPESQKPAHYDNGIAALNDWPRITHTFTGEIADAVESDLTTVYKNKLENYTRTLLYTKHGPLFLFDHVRSFSDEGHTFSWLFHAPQNEGNQRSLDYVENRLTVERPGARLTMDVLSPDISSAPIRDNNDPGYPESFVSLNTVPGRTEADFLAVMVPEAPADGEYGSRPLVEKIRVQGWLGARVKHREMVDYGFFRTNSGVFPVEGFTTDASRFTASFDSRDRLVRFYVQGSFFEGYGESMNSSGPVTMALSHESGETRLEVDSGTPGRITFAVLERPEQILLDTSPVRYNYDSDSGRTSLQIPDGRHDILVKY